MSIALHILTALQDCRLTLRELDRALGEPERLTVALVDLELRGHIVRIGERYRLTQAGRLYLQTNGLRDAAKEQR